MTTDANRRRLAAQDRLRSRQRRLAAELAGCLDAEAAVTAHAAKVDQVRQANEARLAAAVAAGERRLAALAPAGQAKALAYSRAVAALAADAGDVEAAELLGLDVKDVRRARAEAAAEADVSA